MDTARAPADRSAGDSRRGNRWCAALWEAHPVTVPGTRHVDARPASR
jgi:hypothetical protein